MVIPADISWLWTDSGSYNFISGPLPDITLLGGVALFWRKHNCHVQRCWRLQWHPHPVHGHPVCKKHHPESPLHQTKAESGNLHPDRHRYGKHAKPEAAAKSPTAAKPS